MDMLLKNVFRRTRVIAVVGFSLRPERASHDVARFLHGCGYRVIPVNPGHAGGDWHGEAIRAQLADCPPEVDMVDIFRRPEHIGPVVEDALAHLPNLRTIWMQLGLRQPHAAALARARGIDVIEDRCPKIDYPRLFGARARDAI
ncbi:MAG: CoA-binding protein [Roseinatronobacter sp.]